MLALFESIKTLLIALTFGIWHYDMHICRRDNSLSRQEVRKQSHDSLASLTSTFLP